MNSLTLPATVRRVTLILCAVIAVVVLAAIAAPQLWYPLWFDQGAFAACANAILHGGAMYRNCWDVRGPAAALAYVIPMLFSSSPVAIHAFDLLCQAITAVLLGLLARDLFSSRAGIVAGVLYWLMYASVNYWATSQAESFANLFFVLTLYTAWRAITGWKALDHDAMDDDPDEPEPATSGLRPWSPWLFLSGACIGILFWFKYPFALISLLPTLLVLWAIRRHTRPPPSRISNLAISYLLSLFLGALLIFFLALAYFAATGALANLQTQIAYDVATFNNVPLSHRLEWLRTTFWEEIVAFVSMGNTPTAGFKDTVDQVSLLGRGYPFVFILAAIGLLTGLARKHWRAATLYALGYLVITLLIDLWQGHFYRYHFLIILPPLALVAAIGDWRLEIRDWTHRAEISPAKQQSVRPSAITNYQLPITTLRVQSLISILLFLAAVVGLAAAMWPWMDDAAENIISLHKTPDALYLESNLAPYSRLARALNEESAPADRIVIFSDVPAVYALAQRQNGTRFPYLRWAQESGSPEVRAAYAQEFLDDLMLNRPRFFVLTQEGFPWEGADFISLWKTMPAIQRYVESHYHYVGENGPFLLFLRNEL